MSKRTYTAEAVNPRSMKQQKLTKPTYFKQNAGLKPELKMLDTDITTDATTTPVITSLNTLATGDTISTREANKIMMKSIELRIAYDNEDVTANNRLRIVVGIDKNANITNPSFFGSATSSIFDGNTPLIGALRQISTMSRFVILKDKVITLNQTSDGALQKGFIKIYVKIPDEYQIASYQNSSSAVPMTNNLFLAYVGDEAAGVADMNFVARCRLRFVG